MNIERVYQGLREMHNFADESVKLYQEEQFPYSTLKFRQQCLKKLIEKNLEVLLTLMSAAQQIGCYNIENKSQEPNTGKI